MVFTLRSCECSLMTNGHAQNVTECLWEGTRLVLGTTEAQCLDCPDEQDCDGHMVKHTTGWGLEMQGQARDAKVGDLPWPAGRWPHDGPL